MRILDESLMKDVKRALGELPGPVTLALFTKRDECPTCRDLVVLLGEVATAHPSIRLEVLDLERDAERARSLGIEDAPAIAVIGGDDRGVRFLGTPGGLEFATLLQAIRRVSRADSELAPALAKRLAALPRPVSIRVFVTPTCPYCPPAVAIAHQIALAASGVRAEMVEAEEFPELADRYGVRGVPRIVIDDRVAIEGAIPATRFVDEVVRAASAA